jgi:hypothetical protein
VETDPATKPSVLFIYYTYTLETLRLVEAMADVLRGRGCEANLGAIAFIDPRYADRFKEFPVPHRPSLCRSVQGVPRATPVPGGRGNDPRGAPPSARSASPTS